MKSNIFKRGFAALIATQFFGAANDNILKYVLIFMLANGLWQGALGAGGQGWACHQESLARSQINSQP